jgi:uncharacterized protein YbjT (DUF2867 family)
MTLEQRNSFRDAWDRRLKRPGVCQNKAVMEVFVTGATGVLGRPVVRLLLDRGHRVRALARSADNESRLRAAGAEPIGANLFDVSTLRAAVNGCDAVLHLATLIPGRDVD